MIQKADSKFMGNSDTTYTDNGKIPSQHINNDVEAQRLAGGLYDQPSHNTSSRIDNSQHEKFTTDPTNFLYSQLTAQEDANHGYQASFYDTNNQNLIGQPYDSNGEHGHSTNPDMFNLNNESHRIQHPSHGNSLNFPDSTQIIGKGEHISNNHTIDTNKIYDKKNRGYSDDFSSQPYSNSQTIHFEHNTSFPGENQNADVQNSDIFHKQRSNAHFTNINYQTNLQSVNSAHSTADLKKKDDDFLKMFESQINYNTMQNTIGQARYDTSNYMSSRYDSQHDNSNNSYDPSSFTSNTHMFDKRNIRDTNDSNGYDTKGVLFNRSDKFGTYNSKNTHFASKTRQLDPKTGMDTQTSTSIYNQQPFIYDSVSDQPLYVNVRQFNYIRKRKARRDFLDTLMRENRKNGYMHESRHRHAMNRKRAPSGRFLTKAETEALRKSGHNFET